MPELVESLVGLVRQIIDQIVSEETQQEDEKALLVLLAAVLHPHRFAIVSDSVLGEQGSSEGKCSGAPGVQDLLQCE